MSENHATGTHNARVAVTFSTSNLDFRVTKNNSSTPLWQKTTTRKQKQTKNKQKTVFLEPFSVNCSLIVYAYGYTIMFTTMVMVMNVPPAAQCIMATSTSYRKIQYNTETSNNKPHQLHLWPTLGNVVGVVLGGGCGGCGGDGACGGWGDIGVGGGIGGGGCTGHIVMALRLIILLCCELRVSHFAIVAQKSDHFPTEKGKHTQEKAPASLLPSLTLSNLSFITALSCWWVLHSSVFPGQVWTHNEHVI